MSEEEIKEGEYVRYKSGVIRKVSRIIFCYENEKLLKDNYYIEFDDKGEVSTYTNKQVEEFIKNHSPDIIDLIEEGDYVNGILINNIRYCDNKKNVGFMNSEDLFEEIFYEGDIKSIVTKEQFQNCEYKVEEE